MRKLGFALLLLVLSLCSQAQQPAPILDDSRLTQATFLQITGNNLEQKQVYGSCFEVPAGRTVSVFAQASVTNPNRYNVGIGSVLRTWDYTPDGRVIAVENITPPVMSNVTPDMHHMVINKAYAGKVAYEDGASVRCYTLVLWAVSDAGRGIIIVEQGYGYLQVLAH